MGLLWTCCPYGSRGMIGRYDTPLRKDTAEVGEKFELYMARLMGWTRCVTKEDQIGIGDTKEGYEIKLDARCTDTRRISIEIAENTPRHLKWMPSGIYAANSAIWYVQGNYKIVWVFLREKLIAYFEEKRPLVTFKKTIATFYLSLDQVAEMSECEIDMRHLCRCGKYGTRSSDFGKTWACMEHDR